MFGAPATITALDAVPWSEAERRDSQQIPLRDLPHAFANCPDEGAVEEMIATLTMEKTDAV